jgi:hypothetical protein
LPFSKFLHTQNQQHACACMWILVVGTMCTRARYQLPSDDVRVGCNRYVVACVVCMCVCVYVCVNMNTYTHSNTGTCRMRIYIRIHTHTYAYIHACMHACKHTHTHTHTCVYTQTKTLQQQEGSQRGVPGPRGFGCAYRQSGLAHDKPNLHSICGLVVTNAGKPIYPALSVGLVRLA